METIQEKPEVHEEELIEPATPTAQFFNSESLSVCILAALESEIPIDDSQTMSLLENVFIPINPRFSSIMVKDDENGGKHWKKVSVKLDDHVQVPVFPEGLPLESYDEYLQEYTTKIAMEQLPQSRPLWEIHIFKYPTTNAAGTLLFKLHHALGDGYSLMGALFSCLQRCDNPSLPLTFPKIGGMEKRKSTVTENLSVFMNTVTDFTWSLMKSSFLEDHVSPIRSATVGVELKPMTISTVTFSLDQTKQIKTKLGGTINDVIVGVIFYGTRLYMEAVSKGSSNAQSTALVLLNTREITTYQTVKEMAKPNTTASWGNNFGFLHVNVPGKADIESTDPLDFVFEAKKLITKKKNSLAVYLNGSLLNLMRKLRGPEVASRYIHKTLWNTSMTISNLIGPVEQMSLANHPIKGLYFCVINAPQSLLLSLVSYMGKVRVTVGGEKELINHKLYNSCLNKAFGKILEAAINS
ncbi:O-acyltransferase WSD1-like [Papaver somniferum]|uniref:O-acyltransferase WSD1-like n=1 Tax=Papaver somniferum TaxID=3469 RepID=UPI000E6F59EB|nr:O-acyltransferase WSD1-like [Papaver somniferum]